jgi:hypothetical protein
MKIVTVDSADLKAVLSLLRVYRGMDKPGAPVNPPMQARSTRSTWSASTIWRGRSKRPASEKPWQVAFSCNCVPVQG